MATDSLHKYEKLVNPYVEMMHRLLAGDVSISSFKEEYQQRYLADDTAWPEPLYDILDTVFATADNVVEDPAVRPHIAFGVSPEELRTRVVAAIVELRDLACDGTSEPSS